MDPVERATLEELQSIVASMHGKATAGALAAAVAENRVWQADAAGSVIAAAGQITLDAAITTKGPLGKVRIDASWSGVGGGAAGGINTILQVKVGAGAFATEYTFAPLATGSHFAQSVSFQFDSGAPAGTLITAHWQTTAGDDAVTIGGAGGGAFGSVLIIQEEL